MFLKEKKRKKRNEGDVYVYYTKFVKETICKQILYQQKKKKETLQLYLKEELQKTKKENLLLYFMKIS